MVSQVCILSGLREQPSIVAITVETLRQFELFDAFTDDELKAIVGLCREASRVEGAKVSVEGQAAERLFVVKRGKLSLEKKLTLGRGKTRLANVGFVGPGNTAGWSTLLPPHLYSSTATCMEPTELIVVDGPGLRRLAEQNPYIGQKLMKLVALLIQKRYQNATGILSQFVSIVSHELRAPLAAIENYLNVVLDGFAGDVTDKQRRFLERSKLRINDLRSLIGDLVDLARMRPEQIQADFEWLDPAQVGADSVEEVGVAAKQKSIRIHTKRPVEFQPIVGSRRRLRQVFTNLLSNAIKFSPKGTTVTFRAWDEPETLVWQIEDEGMGIPKDEQPFIFEQFFRGSGASEVSGTGLGLSVVKAIIDAHEGQIEVESPYSSAKQGTRFTVRIPRHLRTPEMKRKEWNEKKE
jgi:signal transduction histidine kinase